MAETIIGRHQEKTLLEKYYNSGKAEFIAMYGRRRIGKTFLIRQYFKNQFSFDMTGVLEGNKTNKSPLSTWHSKHTDIQARKIQLGWMPSLRFANFWNPSYRTVRDA